MSVDEIQIKEWARKGSMLVRCDCLEEDDPMHPYNQILALGEKPEEFGVFTSEVYRLRRENTELKKENAKLRERAGV